MPPPDLSSSVLPAPTLPDGAGAAGTASDSARAAGAPGVGGRQKCPSTGWGTYGFKAGPAAGYRVAELIATGKVPEVIQPFALSRFANLQPLGEKAAAALADFIVLDMFANVCTGREDAKGAIKIAERQALRLYR